MKLITAITTRRVVVTDKNAPPIMHIKLLLFSLILITLIYKATTLPPVIRIGAIFTEDERDSNVESIFKYAIYRINKDKYLLGNTQLVYDIAYVSSDDSFRTTKKVCRQLENDGVQCIFGPSDQLLAMHVQSICENYDIPHIETRIDLDAKRSKEFSINLNPSQYYMNLAFRDLMIYLNWTKVAIIYEDDNGLFKQQDLMHATVDIRTEMYIRQASPDTYRHVLRAIRQKEIYKIIVDTNSNNIKQFFRAILQLQMNDYRYHYMFTTFDIESYDLEDFKYNGVNITAFRLVDVDSQRYKEVFEQMQKFQHSGIDIIEGQFYIQTLPALMFDAVYTLAAGLMEMDQSHSLSVRNISCDHDNAWDDGLTLYNYINSVELTGLTGNINFIEGRRSKFKLDLLKLKGDTLKKVGYWTNETGIKINNDMSFYDINMTNITLVIITREEKPYVMVKNDANLTGNARFEGFCIDLLKAIALQVGFQYKIELVPDNMYGVYNPETNTWNGIVRELMERRADLAVASMTINYARESVIDFTKPFMNLGIGILFKVPTSQPTRLFSFMNPLAMEIWLYVLAAYILVSFTLFVMARFSPYEWNSMQQQQQQQHQQQHHYSQQLLFYKDYYDIIENQFSVSNSFWFITGTFLRQGSGLNPQKSDRTQSRFFSFMNPLAVDIWFYIAFGYILVSLTIWIVARFSPIEWVNLDTTQTSATTITAATTEKLIENNPNYFDNVDKNNYVNIIKNGKLLINEIDNNNYNEEEEEKEENDQQQQNIHFYNNYNDNNYDNDDDVNVEELKTELICLRNNFTLKNSFWFAMGALMQQGSDLFPRATSTRIVGGIWWFFTLIIISSYTANLAAFLTVERMITPIESAADLAEQTDINYGTLEGGSTMTFFRDSKIGIYQKMWRYMENRRSAVFVKTYEDGIARVMQGNYAFLMESTMLDYAVQRDCNLTQIGGLLDSKGYGIATPKGSPWRDPMSLSILELQEKGIIQILYDKWWKNTGDVCNRDDKSKESKANALGVENIGGVFVVLLCGLALAVVVAILEFCWNSKRNLQQQQQYQQNSLQQQQHASIAGENQSLCSEMAEELKFAINCHGTKQQHTKTKTTTAIKRNNSKNCLKCMPVGGCGGGTTTTYVPAATTNQQQHRTPSNYADVHYNYFH